MDPHVAPAHDATGEPSGLTSGVPPIAMASRGCRSSRHVPSGKHAAAVTPMPPIVPHDSVPGGSWPPSVPSTDGGRSQ